MEKNLSKMAAPTGKIVRLGDSAYVTVFMNGESLTLRASESQEAFDSAITALRNEDWDLLYQVMRPVKSFASKVAGVTVTNTGVYWNGEELHNSIAERIMDFALSGLDHQPLCNFLSKLMGNPSKRAINELYTFLEHKNLPITDNGNLLAYKGIQSNWYSKTSGSAKLLQGKGEAGKIFNGVGEVIEIARDAVNDDANIGCSYGLHAGTEEYARSFASGGRTVIVEINPTDVVSIPLDCSCQKLRTCKYKVVGEYEGTLSKPLYDSKWKPEADFVGDVKSKPVNTGTKHAIRDSSGRFVSNKPKTTKSSTKHAVRDSSGRFVSNGPQGKVATKSTGRKSFSFLTPSSGWISSVDWTWNAGDPELTLNRDDGTSIVHEGVGYDLAQTFEIYVANGGSAGVFYNKEIKHKF